jgi:hypothetical protein
MTAPHAGASWDAGWHWVDGALVYGPKARWVLLPPSPSPGGAVRDEVVDDFRNVSRVGRSQRTRWSDLRAEIHEEFREYSHRQHDVEIVLEERLANRREWLRQYALHWRASNPHKARASAQRQHARLKRAERDSDRWVCCCRNCEVLFCPVRTRAAVHCTDACRLKFGRTQAEQRLAAKFGTTPVEARRVQRMRERRARGIGPRKQINIATGTQVGFWIVVCAVRFGKKPRHGYRCRCRCGRERLIAAGHLAAGKVLSCRGCRYKRVRDERA